MSAYSFAGLNRQHINFSIEPDSSGSFLVIGVFPQGTAKSEVRKLVQGSWGGMFERWDEAAGEFVYRGFSE